MAGIYAPDGSMNVTIVNDDTTAEDVSTIIGAITDAAEVDPSEDATVVSLLKGILTALNTIADNTGTP